MTVTIVIPVYNEEKTLEELVSHVRAAKMPAKKEIILVDDCSRDNTRQVIEKRLKGKVQKVVYHEVNQGKGAALRSGFAAATGDIVIVQDADLEYDPREIAKVLAPIVDGRADVVYGSRFIGSEAHRVLYYWHAVGNKMLTMASNMFSNLNLTDMETCYKAFRRDILKRITIQENRFGFEPEITAKVAKLNARIYEVGISYSGRTYEEGKKIGLKDAFRALYCIIRYNVFG
ncbi:MAG: glycosyltransferase family 2 protein [Spirochaetota bacterium]